MGQQVAGKYRLVELIGAGGMGAVYEAVHEFTQRRVAVKLMHPSIARSGVAADRFLREARAPSSIGHPGIVEVLDGGYDGDGSLYLVLELLEGRTLGEAIEAGDLSAREVSAIALELLDALAAAHDAGFVHRDIKPENVFLVNGADGARPRVKLLDFGIAGVMSADARAGLTVAGAVLGTPLYMSPEQALGRRVDARSDLWSVGAVLYRALTGRAPFTGDSFQALVVSISTQEILPLSVVRPELPVRLTGVVERALHKNAEQRWQTASAMAEALERALAHDRDLHAPPTAHEGGAPLPPALSSALQAPARAPKTPWLVPAVVAALSAAAIGAWFVGFARGGAQPLPPASSELELAARPQPTRVQPGEPAREPEPGSGQPAAPATTEPGESEPGSGRPAAPATAEPDPARGEVVPAQPAGLSSAQLAQVLQRHEGELQRCYEEVVVAALMKGAPGEHPQLSPVRLDVQFEVAPGGDVDHIELHGRATAELQECARAAIRNWRFPHAAVSTEVRLPVIFQPNVVQR